MIFWKKILSTCLIFGIKKICLIKILKNFLKKILSAHHIFKMILFKENDFLPTFLPNDTFFRKNFMPILFLNDTFLRK